MIVMNIELSKVLVKLLLRWINLMFVWRHRLPTQLPNVLYQKISKAEIHGKFCLLPNEYQKLLFYFLFTDIVFINCPIHSMNSFFPLRGFICKRLHYHQLHIKCMNLKFCQYINRTKVLVTIIPILYGPYIYSTSEFWNVKVEICYG